MSSDNERGVLRGLAGMNAEISRLMRVILDDTVSVQDEIDFGNSLIRGGRALVRDGKKRVRKSTRAADSNAASGT